LTVSVRFAVPVWPVELTAVTTCTACEATAEGVPETPPVAGLKLSPAGSEGLIEKPTE